MPLPYKHTTPNDSPTGTEPIPTPTQDPAGDKPANPMDTFVAKVTAALDEYLHATGARP